jgi:hypothetical protein
MQRATYHRQQANLLLKLAMTTSNPVYAEALERLARIYLTQTSIPDDPCADFERLVDDFNDHQMRRA